MASRIKIKPGAAFGNQPTDAISKNFEVLEEYGGFEPAVPGPEGPEGPRGPEGPEGPVATITERVPPNKPLPVMSLSFLYKSFRELEIIEFTDIRDIPRKTVHSWTMVFENGAGNVEWAGEPVKWHEGRRPDLSRGTDILVFMCPDRGPIYGKLHMRDVGAA